MQACNSNPQVTFPTPQAPFLHTQATFPSAQEVLNLSAYPYDAFAQLPAVK